MYSQFEKKGIWGLILPPVLGGIFLVFILFAVILPSIKENLITQKKEMIQALAQTAYDVLRHQEKKVRSGELDIKSSQQEAIRAIRLLRYGPENKDYFWINDMQHVMVMHPYRSDLEGQSVERLKDPHGKFLFVEAVKIVRRDQGGFLSYDWQWKDNPDKIVPKISYVKGFEPWGWIIGTGIYLEDIHEDVALIQRRLGVLFGVTFLIVGLITGFIAWQGWEEAGRRRKAEKDLADHLEHLEENVEKRTQELAESNAMLEQQVKTRMRTENELLKQKEFLQEVIESLPYPFYVISSSNYSILMANYAAMEDEDWLGRHCYEVTHFRDTPCNEKGHCCPLEEVKRTKKPAVTEHLHYDAEGNTQYVEVRGYPIFDDEGNVVQMIEYVIDISARKKAELSLKDSLDKSHSLAKELEQRHRELEHAHHDLKQTQSQMLQQEKMASVGVLAAGVAHEINNPIGFIISNLGTLGKYLERLTEFQSAQSQALQSSDRGGQLSDLRKTLKVDYISEDSKDLIQESLEGADRVKEIVQNLKSFSRLDEIEEQSANINDCLEKTIKMVWNELKYKTTLTKEFGDIPSTLCFPQELNQVFMNLLINAAHAIEKQGEITIKTWQENGWINAAISDTGYGIPQESLEKIFDPFYTTKAVGKGTGLGLSICYDLVKKHHGHIEVASEQGQGTTFTVQIPIRKS